MTRLTHWCNFDSARTRILEAGRAPTSPLYPPAPPSLQNNFERAQTDVFAVKGTDIGDVQRVVVWHDNSGPGPAWHLQQVEGGGGSLQGREGGRHRVRLGASAHTFIVLPHISWTTYPSPLPTAG